MNNILIKKYQIKVLTGLHIGAGKEGFEIGEMDNPVVKDFATGIPYIPGSSIKGKIRFLLEKKYQKGSKQYQLIQDLFGRPAEEEKKQMTILVFRDAFVQGELEEELKEKMSQGEPITEEKTEVALRDQNKPNPRPIERVPKGYLFQLEVVFRFYEVEEEEKRKAYMELFEEGLKLLEDDYLGGSGSRGYGKVKIEEIK